jgi:Holliday junction resolvasome RuvABC endonuclease subunit
MGRGIFGGGAGVIALGIDAATNTGFGLVRSENRRETLIAHGELDFATFPAKWELAETIVRLAREYHPDVVAIELPYMHKNAHALEVLARFCGRFEQALEPTGAKVRVIRANQWQPKMLGTCRMKRDALKKLAVAWCRSNFGVALPEDAADAAVMAVFALRFPE